MSSNITAAGGDNHEDHRQLSIEKQVADVLAGLGGDAAEVFKPQNQDPGNPDVHLFVPGGMVASVTIKIRTNSGEDFYQQVSEQEFLGMVAGAARVMVEKINFYNAAQAQAENQSQNQAEGTPPDIYDRLTAIWDAFGKAARRADGIEQDISEVKTGLKLRKLESEEDANTLQTVLDRLAWLEKAVARLEKDQGWRGSKSTRRWRRWLFRVVE